MSTPSILNKLFITTRVSHAPLILKLLTSFLCKYTLNFLDIINEFVILILFHLLWNLPSSFYFLISNKYTVYILHEKKNIFVHLFTRNGHSYLHQAYSLSFHLKCISFSSMTHVSTRISCATSM